MVAARCFAEALAQAEPERFTATMAKSKRHGKIFIDWLRNQRGAIAVPIAWDDLETVGGGGAFRMSDSDRLTDRANALGLSGWGFADQPLPPL